MINLSLDDMGWNGNNTFYIGKLFFWGYENEKNYYSFKKVKQICNKKKVEGSANGMTNFSCEDMTMGIISFIFEKKLKNMQQNKGGELSEWNDQLLCPDRNHPPPPCHGHHHCQQKCNIFYAELS